MNIIINIVHLYYMSNNKENQWKYISTWALPVREDKSVCSLKNVTYK